MSLFEIKTFRARCGGRVDGDATLFPPVYLPGKTIAYNGDAMNSSYRRAVVGGHLQ